MKVTTTPAPAPPPSTQKKEDEDDGFWRDLFSGELLELAGRVNMAEIVESSRGLGNALKGVWKNAREIVGKILDVPLVDDRIDSGTEHTITRGTDIAAYSLGYGASGVQGLAGLYKIVNGRRKGDHWRVVDGAFDLATSAAIGVSVAGLGGAQSVLVPFAAGVGALRGGYGGLLGYRKGDPRADVQGILDATRSSGTFLHSVGGGHGALEVASKVLVPVAGLLQIGRGYFDIRTGLRTGSNQRELWGLTDMATAVGMTLATTGLATIPGVALTVAASSLRIVYQISDRGRGVMDRGIDRLEPLLGKVVRQGDRVIVPASDRVRKTLGLEPTPLLEG